MMIKHAPPNLKRGLTLAAALLLPSLDGAETLTLDFAQEKLPAGWSVTSPRWKAVQGKLEGTGDGALEYAGPVTGDFTLKFTGWTGGKCNLELKTIDLTTGQDVYTFAFLGRYHRVLEGVKCCILREDTFVSVDPKQWIYPGRRFTCEIRVSRGRYQMFLDGEPGPEFVDPQPLRPAQGTKLRLLANTGGGEDRVQIENVRLVLASRVQPEKTDGAGSRAAAPPPAAARRTRGIFVVPLAPGQAAIRGPATPLSTLSPEPTCTPAWSPDGKSIAFKRRVPPSVDARFVRFDWVVRDWASGRERVYPSRVADLGCWSGPLWYPDGRHLLAKSFVDGGQRNFRFDLESGRSSEVVLPPYKPAVAIARDGRRLYCMAPDDIANAIDLVAIDPATGEQESLWRSPFGFHFVWVPLRLVLSPDGRTLAVILPEGATTSHLVRINTDGSGYRLLYSAQGNAAGGSALSRSGLAWTDRGNALLFLEGSPAGQRLLRISADGGTPEFTGLVMGGGDVIMDVSPDGTRLALSPGEPILSAPLDPP